MNLKILFALTLLLPTTLAFAESPRLSGIRLGHFSTSIQTDGFELDLLNLDVVCSWAYPSGYGALGVISGATWDETLERPRAQFSITKVKDSTYDLYFFATIEIAENAPDGAHFAGCDLSLEYADTNQREGKQHVKLGFPNPAPEEVINITDLVKKTLKKTTLKF